MLKFSVILAMACMTSNAFADKVEPSKLTGWVVNDLESPFKYKVDSLKVYKVVDGQSTLTESNCRVDSNVVTAMVQARIAEIRDTAILDEAKLTTPVKYMKLVNITPGGYADCDAEGKTCKMGARFSPLLYPYSKSDAKGVLSNGFGYEIQEASSPTCSVTKEQIENIYREASNLGIFKTGTTTSSGTAERHKKVWVKGNNSYTDGCAIGRQPFDCMVRVEFGY